PRRQGFERVGLTIVSCYEFFKGRLLRRPFLFGAGDFAREASRRRRSPTSGQRLTAREIVRDEAAVDVSQQFEIGDARMLVDLVDRRIDQAKFNDRTNVLDETRIRRAAAR